MGESIRRCLIEQTYSEVQDLNHACLLDFALVPRRAPEEGNLGQAMRKRSTSLNCPQNRSERTVLTCPRSLVQHYESRVDSIESTGSSLAAAKRRGGAPSAATSNRAT